MKIISPINREPLKAKKIYRNELCECGSGKKAKKCCGADTVYYTKFKNKLKKFFKKFATLEIHLFDFTVIPNLLTWHFGFFRIKFNDWVSALFCVTKDTTHRRYIIDIFYSKKIIPMKRGKYVTIQEPVKRITKTRNIGMTIKPQAKDIYANNLIAVICFDWADFDDYIRSLYPKQIIQGLHDTYIIDKYTYQAVYEIHHPRGNEYIYIEEAERAKENPNYAKIKECTIAGLTKKITLK